MTELCEHPSRRATSVIEAPAFKRSTARRLRRSSSSGLPCGLIPEQYRAAPPVSIIYAHVNNVIDRRDLPWVRVNDARWAGTLERTREATAKTMSAIQRLCAEDISVSLIVTLHRGKIGRAHV